MYTYNQFDVVVKVEIYRFRFKSIFIYRSSLVDFGPITYFQPNLSHQVADVDKIRRKCTLSSGGKVGYKYFFLFFSLFLKMGMRLDREASDARARLILLSCSCDLFVILLPFHFMNSLFNIVIPSFALHQTLLYFISNIS